VQFYEQACKHGKRTHEAHGVDVRTDGGGEKGKHEGLNAEEKPRCVKKIQQYRDQAKKRRETIKGFKVEDKIPFRPGAGTRWKKKNRAEPRLAWRGAIFCVVGVRQSASKYVQTEGARIKSSSLARGKRWTPENGTAVMQKRAHHKKKKNKRKEQTR